MRNLFGNELSNTGRQFEFDMAKAVCILGMVFVHCFEQLTSDAVYGSEAAFVMVVVLDALFGAATFMSAMGLGIAYSWREGGKNAERIMKRGVIIFLLGYVLNFLRYGIFDLTIMREINGDEVFISCICDTLTHDILPFAGLALFLFGLLKRLKFSDRAVLLVALAMSIIGSFIRFLEPENIAVTAVLGLFVGAFDNRLPEFFGVFPLFNWFIIVVGGYLYGQALKHCKNTHKYYSIAFPVSAVILAIYVAIAIPNRLGMMNEDLYYYYQMTTFDALICFIGMIFATSLYHFISFAFGDKVKKVIKRMSSNINSVYCIHWVIIGFIDSCLIARGDVFAFSNAGVFLVGSAIYLVANVLAEIYTRYKDKKKAA